MVAVLGGILPPITVLMTLMALGLVLGRFKVLGKDFNKGLNFLVLKVSLPCLIVVSMQKPFSQALASLGGWALLISFLLYAGLFVLGTVLVGWTKMDPDKKGVYRFVILFSNVGFMGFPLMDALWGRDSVFLGAMFNVCFNLFVFSVGVWILTRHRSDRRAPLKDIFLNPGLIATVLGTVLFLTSTALPPLVYKVADTLGSLTTPLSMVLVGSMLAQSSFRAVWKGRAIWGLTGLRLILIPLGVWAVLLPFAVPREVSRLAVLVAAMPAAANTSLLAAEHLERPELASQAVFVTTALSFVTIPLMVVLLGLG